MALIHHRYFIYLYIIFFIYIYLCRGGGPANLSSIGSQDQLYIKDRVCHIREAVLAGCRHARPVSPAGFTYILIYVYNFFYTFNAKLIIHHNT